MRIFYILSTLTLMVSCQCEDTPKPIATVKNADGAIVTMQHLWKQRLRAATSNAEIDKLEPAPRYGENILVGTAIGSQQYWQLMRVADGMLGDKWAVDVAHVTSVSSAYQKDSLFLTQEGSRSYNINLTDATLAWYKKRDMSFYHVISGLGSTFFIQGYSHHPENAQNLVGYWGDVSTGEIEEFLYPKFQTSYLNPNQSRGGTNQILPVLQPNGEIWLAVFFADALPNWHSRGYWGLYNFTQRKWVYEKQPVYKDTTTGGGNDGAPWAKVVGDKMYAAAGNGIACNDLYTGAQVWEHGPFRSDFLFSGCIIEDNKFVANCEDGNLYCYHAQTGELLWQVKNTGTCSPMFTLNGVIYYTGGGDGLLHAVELSSGNHLWKLKCPDHPDSWFWDSPYVIPGENGAKGRIIIRTTADDAYCYEAAR